MFDVSASCVIKLMQRIHARALAADIAHSSFRCFLAKLDFNGADRLWNSDDRFALVFGICVFRPLAGHRGTLALPVIARITRLIVTAAVARIMPLALEIHRVQHYAQNLRLRFGQLTERSRDDLTRRLPHLTTRIRPPEILAIN